MEHFPGMQDPTIITAIVITIIVGISIGCVFTIAHGLKHDTWPRDPEGVWWFRGGLIAIGLVVLLGYMQDRDERAAYNQNVIRQPALQKFRCPEKQPGDTDIILLTLDVSADAHTDKPFRVTDCARIVERAYVRMHRKAVAKAAP